MPGWGITANLLPPELIAARRLKTVRKMIVAALVLVVVLGAAGYGYGMYQQGDAESALAAEQAQTAQLVAQQQKYQEVVTISGSIAQVKGQLATLMTGDVDVAKLVGIVTARQPHGGTITQLQATLVADPAQPSTDGGASVFDNSGHTHIGTMNITGTAPNMPAVAAYVNQLGSASGIVGVFPSSQTGANHSVQYTIQLTLTDALLTHRFDMVTTTPTGGK
jgi:hypothetical protein